jgi:GMP synthase (glutamine-hydrolysing)
MLKLLYICQFAEPWEHDLSIYRGQDDGDDDAGWFAARLRELGLDDVVDLSVARVCLGETIPDPCDFDAAVIGGSYHMVGEGRAWQHRVLGWLGSARGAGLPVLGICGGHQLMALHYGAQVGPLTEGTCSGTLSVERTRHGHRHWLFRGVAETVGFHFGNSEHVAPPPAGAKVLARSPTSPALALDYGDRWVSVQFHPEMTAPTFVRYWRTVEPHRVADYRASPEAALLLRNFVDQAVGPER